MSSAPKRHSRGVAMIVVLLLMTVLILGALGLARMSEVGTLAAGNSATRAASVQASEVGVNAAYQSVLAITDEEVDQGGWYRSTMQPADEDGLPQLDFDAAVSIDVGPYTASYVVERQCTVAVVTEPARQCLVKQVPQLESARVGDGADAPEPLNARQFRITVRVTGPKNTLTWIQSLITKG